MKEALILNQQLDPKTSDRIREAGLFDLWCSGEPVSGGRGSARKITLENQALLIKKEKRGGFAGQFLPDVYLSIIAFENEWEVSNKASEAGMAPRMIARLYRFNGLLFSLYTLIEWLEDAQSLQQFLETGKAGDREFHLAGKAISLMHKVFISHGDLNAGNIMLAKNGKVWIVDFRHSRVFSEPIEASLRHSNLSRLARSIKKLIHNNSVKALSSPPWSSIADGYAEGWGEREEWLDGWIDEASKKPGLRRLFWKNRSSDQDS